MSFLSPAFLMALPLIGIPVLIHFFGKRQRDVVRWGAMEFLMRSVVPRRRFLRLRDLLLMLLRIAVVLAVVAALAQPMISSHRLGSSVPRDVVLVIDNSMSTARKTRGGPLFDTEVDEARRFMDGLNPSDMIRVMLASPRPEWLTDTPLPADAGTVRELINRLKALSPTEASSDMLDCFQEAIKAPAAGNQMPKFVVAISDTQARSWRPDAPGAWAALQALAKKTAPPVFLNSILVEQGTAAANLAVEKISAARPIVAPGQPAILTASIKNTGTETSEATTVSWVADGQALGVSAIPSLPAGAGTTVSISQPFATAGLVEISCRIAADDDLAPDNSARFLLEVARSTPVLVVEGEPESDPMQSDTAYFLATLGVTGANDSTTPSLFSPKLIGYRALGAEDLSAFRCVVLADVPRLSSELAQKLAHYVNSGGGLWIAPGEQTDVTAFNREFYEQSTGLSPVPLLPAVGDADDREKFIGLVPPAAEHPATALLADIQRLDIDKVRVYRRFPFDTAKTPQSVLLRLEGGEPLVVEKSLGRGRVIVQAIPLGVAWSSFPLCQSYVVMANEWLWYLSEPGLSKRNLRAGEAIEFVRPAESSAESCSLQMPDGRTTQVVGDDESGRMMFRFSKTSAPGEYAASVSGATEKFLVNRDAAESDLTPLNDVQLKVLAATAGIVFGSDPFAGSSAVQAGPAPSRPLAHWLLEALIALMAIEAVIAFLLARQRRVKAAPVVMQPGIQT